MRLGAILIMSKNFLCFREAIQQRLKSIILFKLIRLVLTMCEITLLFRGASLITNNSCMEDNIDYKGNTIDVRDNVPSPAACQDLCEKNDLCHLWSWVGHTVNKWVGYTVTVTAQKCHLKNKSAESSRRSLPRVISGKKNCSER